MSVVSLGLATAGQSGIPNSEAERAALAEDLLKRYAARASNLHLDGSEDWSVSPETVRFLARHVSHGATTLETGAGLSTITLAALGAQHICVCPDAGEIERIKTYCAANNIAAEGVDFRNALSEVALPGLDAPPLDLVLIDGGHGFPMPVIDWYFTAGKLKQGGVMVIDDTHLWSCGMLVDFLKQDAAWTSLGRIGRRTYAFRKVAPFEYLEFCFQPYVLRKSRVSILTAKLLVAWDLIVAGQAKEFLRRALGRRH